MLVLKLTDRERIVIETPSGDVTLQLMEHSHVGIDAPREWGVRRYPRYEGDNVGSDDASDVSNGKQSAGSA